MLDRLTILAIKADKARGEALGNVVREREALGEAWAALGVGAAEAQPEWRELAAVNLTLWEVEDRLRALEAAGDFGAAFVTDARSVYRQNDRRAALKRAVNLRLGSELVEEKVHPAYRTGD